MHILINLIKKTFNFRLSTFVFRLLTFTLLVFLGLTSCDLDPPTEINWDNPWDAMNPNPPRAPEGAEAQPISITEILFQWDDMSGNEDGFKIERKTGASGQWSQIIQVAASVTEYLNTDLSRDTKYYYRIRAFNDAGNSGYSNETSAITSEMPPVAPSNLSAEVVSSSEINLSWTNNSHIEDGFKIERKMGAGGQWSQIGQVTAGVMLYRDTDLSPDTKYYYRVRAFNDVGNSGYSNEASATTEVAPPVAPSDLRAETVSSSQIDLFWEDNSDNEDGFDVEFKRDVSGQWTQLGQVSANSETCQTINLLPDTKYYYRMRAYNNAGYSGYSNIASSTTYSGFLYSDNFDDDPLDQFPNGEEWDVSENGSSTCRISNARSYPAGGRSVRICDATVGEDNSVIMSCAHEALVSGNLSLWLYFPSAGGFGVRSWDSDSSKYSFSVEFSVDGSIIAANGQDFQIIMQDYPIGEWMYLEISYDSVSDQYSVRINDVNRAVNYNLRMNESSIEEFYFVAFSGDATLPEVFIDNVMLSGTQ